MPWRSLSAVATGTAKLAHGRECEDAVLVDILNHGNVLVAALADGAGSARYSSEGATLAVRVALEVLLAQDWNSRPDDSHFHTVLRSAADAARDALTLESAEHQDRSVSDYACTLLVIVAAPDWLGAMQVGDGFIVAGVKDGKFVLAVPPDKGEFANETSFVTSPGSENVRTAVVHDFSGFVFVSSDGLENVALRMRDMEPHQPFFQRFHDFTRSSPSDAAALEQLEKFLKSPRITERTDDDRSVVVGAFLESSSS